MKKFFRTKITFTRRIILFSRIENPLNRVKLIPSIKVITVVDLVNNLVSHTRIDFVPH